MEDGRDERYVTWGRWDEAHARLRDQLDALRAWARDELAGIGQRVGALEAAEGKRRDHRWALALALLTGLLLPLIVAAVAAWTAAHGP